MQLEHFLRRCRCIPERGSPLRVLLPLCAPCYFCLLLALSSKRGLEWKELRRLVCSWCSPSICSPACSFFCGYVCCFVALNPYVSRYPSNSYWSSSVLEVLDLAGDLLQDVDSCPSFGLGDRPYSGLVVCVDGDVASASVSICVFLCYLQRQAYPVELGHVNG